jgi:hypothetical protein
VSERVSAFTVVFGSDISEEHARKVADLIRQIHGVMDVTAHAVKNPESYVALTRTRRDVLRAIHGFFDDRAMREHEG